MKLQRLPLEVDPFRMVDQGRCLQGRIPVSDFSRLLELLYIDDQQARDNDVEVVDVTLQFGRTDTGLPMVEGKISCQLDLCCQRCLESVKTPIESELSIVFVSSDEQAVKLQQGYDTWLVEDNSLMLRDFIEDEILLALPIVVAHDVCEPVRNLIEVSPDEVGAIADTQKENPFAVLKNLKLEK